MVTTTFTKIIINEFCIKLQITGLFQSSHTTISKYLTFILTLLNVGQISYLAKS